MSDELSIVRKEQKVMAFGLPCDGQMVSSVWIYLAV